MPRSNQRRDVVLPPPNPETGSRIYDWPTLRKHYVEGVTNPDTGMTDWLSLDRVAIAAGVDPTWVRRRAATERWVDERNAWRQQIETERRAARSAMLAAAITEVETKATDTSKLGLELIHKRLAEIQMLQNARSKGHDTQMLDPLIDALEMTRLASAADLFHRIALRAMGLAEGNINVELHGGGGGPIEITQELARDDPSRTANVLGILVKANLDEILDVEVVDHGDAGGDDPGAEAGARG